MLPAGRAGRFIRKLDAGGERGPEPAGESAEKAEPRRAVAVVHVDDRVSEAALKALRQIPAIEQAKAIRLF